MLSFSETAKGKLNQLTAGKDSSLQGIFLKKEDGQTVQVKTVELNQLQVEEEPLRDPNTHFFVEHEGFLVIVTKEEQSLFQNVILDFDQDQFLTKEVEEAQGFAPLDNSNPLVVQVQNLLNNEINPGLAMHGGRAELLTIEDNVVYLRFGGGCQGCSQIDVTVKQGIEQRLKQAFPQIKGVADHTDHTAGANPFFK
ncbi:MAG: NifU family protein [Deltaproteobacteria bacterium]|nr:NifU family protein [Deltaproteobacteria bacterium]